MSVPDFAARPQLSEDVARFVRKRIFDGTYAAGEYIRLDQLAAELGISVTPVREALFELRAEGLIAQQPHRGLRGVAGDRTRPRRRRQRAGACRAASSPRGRRSTSPTTSCANSRQIQAQLEEAYAGGDDERTVRLNHEFHRAINVAADSPKLAQLMSQITRYAPESVFPAIEGWPDQSIKDHRRILSALRDTRRQACPESDVGASGGGRGAADRPSHRAWRGRRAPRAPECRSRA